MELAIAPRVLPCLPQSRLLIPRPVVTSSIRFRPRRGLRSSSISSSGSDFWSTVADGEETTRIAVAEKQDEAPPIEKEEEVKEEVSDADEVKEEEVSSEEVTGEQSPANDLLNQLNINLDSEDKSKLLVYGAGALVALWISSIVVSAVDSIPLFPKLMEIVGLGYTVWFSSRYLLFKDNREELFTKIVELKDQILGSDDE